MPWAEEENKTNRIGYPSLLRLQTIHCLGKPSRSAIALLFMMALHCLSVFMMQACVYIANQVLDVWLRMSLNLDQSLFPLSKYFLNVMNFFSTLYIFNYQITAKMYYIKTMK